MRHLTIAEAAAIVDVTPFTIRRWVSLGYLAPLKRNTKPVLFREVDVIECHLARQAQTRHRDLDALADLWRVACGE